MEIKISKTNSKLGGEIPSVNLPPISTCRNNAPCKKVCYACKGNFTYNKVKTSLNNNYALYIHNKDSYFEQIIDFLSNKLTTYKFFRWHSAGDIINEEYLEGMIKVAKKCKRTKFLAFTKKFELVNDYLAKGGAIPNNLKIVYSAWDKGFKVDNPFNLPVAYINFKKKESNPDIPELAIPCTGKCYECLSCWTLRKGQSVVFDQH